MHVYSGLAEKVERELDRLTLAPPISISNVTDPCQPVPELRAEVSRLVSLLIKKGVWFYVTTKGDPRFLLDVPGFAGCARKFVSMTVEGPKEMVDLLSPRAASFDLRMSGIADLSAAGVDVGVRLDPFLPHLAQAVYGRRWKDKVRALLSTFCQSGARHVISSTGRFWSKRAAGTKSAWANVHRIVKGISPDAALAMQREYVYDSSCTAKGYLLRRDIRLALHREFRDMAEETGMTYAVCQELPFGAADSAGIPHCERFPMSFTRKVFGGSFQPIDGCTAYCHRDCSGKKDPPCGRPSLAKPGPFTRSELL